MKKYEIANDLVNEKFSSLHRDLMLFEDIKSMEANIFKIMKDIESLKKDIHEDNTMKLTNSDELDNKIESGTELDVASLNRLDDIYNAAFEFIKVLVEDDDLEWDMNMIGNVTEDAVSYLVDRGFIIHYPGIIHDGETAYVEKYVASELDE